MGLRISSLRALTGAFTLAFLIATVGTGYATYSATRTTIIRLVDRRIEVASRIVAGERGAGAPQILRRIAAFDERRSTGDIGFILRGADGVRLGGNIDLARPLPPGFSSLRAADHVAGLTAGRALVRAIGGGMTLTTIAETEPVENYDAARIRIYLLGFGSIVFIVLAGQIVFGLVIRRRIAEMRRTVEAIVAGDMTRRVPVDPSGGEFAEQALAFNRMLDRIAELMAGIVNVSSDIAHDLRTPLARLRSRIALIQRRPDAAPIAADLSAAVAQSDELLAMFGAILRIAEIEGSDRQSGFTRFDLAAAIDETASMMAPVAADGGRRIVVVPATPVEVRGDARLLNQAVINVIENALHYTPPGTRIVVTTTRVGTEAVVTITDNGPGIAPKDRPAAMRRFGRLDPSRHALGHGLGLPLVDAIMRLHRGQVALEAATPGLRVKLTLPVA